MIKLDMLKDKRFLTLLAVVASLAAFVFGGNKLYDHAFKQGMKTYHGMCYHIGGILVDKEEGTVVQCMPLAQVPKQEIENLQKELDKQGKV